MSKTYFVGNAQNINQAFDRLIQSQKASYEAEVDVMMSYIEGFFEVYSRWNTYSNNHLSYLLVKMIGDVVPANHSYLSRLSELEAILFDKHHLLSLIITSPDFQKYCDLTYKYEDAENSESLASYFAKIQNANLTHKILTSELNINAADSDGYNFAQYLILHKNKPGIIEAKKLGIDMTMPVHHSDLPHDASSDYRLIHDLSAEEIDQMFDDNLRLRAEGNDLPESHENFALVKLNSIKVALIDASCPVNMDFDLSIPDHMTIEREDNIDPLTASKKYELSLIEKDLSAAYIERWMLNCTIDDLSDIILHKYEADKERNLSGYSSDDDFWS
ncbi:MAG: hypothetical protein SFT91_02900 [Rickettsiaceae bacterium]|nr:hypothetical protein [Rickettsiaceae bacterium]